MARPPKYGAAMTPAEQKRRRRAELRAQMSENEQPVSENEMSENQQPMSENSAPVRKSVTEDLDDLAAILDAPESVDADTLAAVLSAYRQLVVVLPEGPRHVLARIRRRIAR